MKVVPVAYLVDPHAHYHMQSMMECYNLSGESEDVIPETKGIRDVAAPDVPTDSMTQPLKINKVNIGTEENPNFPTLGTIGTRRPWKISQTYCISFKTYSQQNS